MLSKYHQVPAEQQEAGSSFAADGSVVRTKFAPLRSFMHLLFKADECLATKFVSFHMLFNRERERERERERDGGRRDGEYQGRKENQAKRWPQDGGFLFMFVGLRIS